MSRGTIKVKLSIRCDGCGKPYPFGDVRSYPDVNEISLDQFLRNRDKYQLLCADCYAARIAEEFIEEIKEFKRRITHG